ncbi:MAG: glycosyltransferase [Actinobacteria bacterium]|nr:MAG: glycosyltransferase [Actinomycetota bacterium]
MFDEIAWLEQAGNEVAHFSTRHPGNDESPWADLFAPYSELGAPGTMGVGERAVAAMRMFSNPEARNLFATLLDRFKPDVVHMHGIHRQLSPSILVAATRRGVPVVQTLHDYHHVCPGDVLLRGGADICEPRACGGVWYGPAIRNRCVRGSLVASSLSAAETSYQRVRRVYESSVTRFVSPSEFLADIMREGGWGIPCDVVPNAVAPVPLATGGSNVLYAGRLSPEKGVHVLLEAARLADIQVVIAGEGPSEADLRRRYPEANFQGRIDESAVQRLIAESLACVVPSTCYENAPMSVLEPMAAGVPVVASSIGGIPEILEHDVSGILVAPGDVNRLAAALSRLKSDCALRTRLGAAGRERVLTRFSPEEHLRRLLQSYAAAMSS